MALADESSPIGIDTEYANREMLLDFFGNRLYGEFANVWEKIASRDYVNEGGVRYVCIQFVADMINNLQEVLPQKKYGMSIITLPLKERGDPEAKFREDIGHAMLFITDEEKREDENYGLIVEPQKVGVSFLVNAGTDIKRLLARYLSSNASAEPVNIEKYEIGLRQIISPNLEEILGIEDN